MEIVKVILTLAIIFILAKTFSRVFSKFGVPGLVGEILLGIILVNLVFDGFDVPEMLDIKHGSTTHEILELFSELGVIFLLFTVGLETKVKDLTSVGKAAILVALLGVLVPFGVGYVFITIYDGNFYHAMFMGAAMVATSVGITARVIKDMRLMDTRESRIIIGAAVIDDILGMIVLAIVSGIAKTGQVDIVEVTKVSVIAVVFVLIVLLVAAKVVPMLYNKVAEYRAKKIETDPTYIPNKPNMFIISLATCLVFACLAEFAGLAMIIGAFLAGMLFAEYAWEWDLEEKFEPINIFFVSFFFVYVGTNVDLSAFTRDTGLIALALIVIVLACATKFIGCGLGAKIADPATDKTSLSIIGCGMMPRGEVGIIVALLGTKILIESEPALSPAMYAVIVVMCIATTLIAPPVLSKLFRKKYPQEYSITDADRL